MVLPLVGGNGPLTRGTTILRTHVSQIRFHAVEFPSGYVAFQTAARAAQTLLGSMLFQLPRVESKRSTAGTMQGWISSVQPIGLFVSAGADLEDLEVKPSLKSLSIKKFGV